LLTSSVWRRSALHYFNIGLLLGALCATFVLVTLGSLIRPLFAGHEGWVLIATCSWVVLVQARVAPQKWLAAHRQVPSDIIERGRVSGPGQFGFEMGTGVRTYMTVPLPYVPACCALLLLDIWSALIVGVGFAMGRAAMTTSRYLHRPNSGSWDAASGRWLPAIQWAMTLQAVGLAAWWAVMAGRI